MHISQKLFHQISFLWEDSPWSLKLGSRTVFSSLLKASVFSLSPTLATLFLLQPTFKLGVMVVMVLNLDCSLSEGYVSWWSYLWVWWCFIWSLDDFWVKLRWWRYLAKVKLSFCLMMILWMKWWWNSFIAWFMKTSWL